MELSKLITSSLESYNKDSAGEIIKKMGNVDNKYILNDMFVSTYCNTRPKIDLNGITLFYMHRLPSKHLYIIFTSDV